MIPEQIQRRYYTISEVAFMLGISIHALNARIKTHGIKIGRSAWARIKSSDIKKLSYKTKRVSASSVLKASRARDKKHRAEIEELKQYIIELKY